jgi:hypothetical protein
MKRWFFIVVSAVMIPSLLILSCNTGPQPVNVHASAKLTGYYYGSDGQIMNGPIPNVKVRFDFVSHAVRGGLSNTLYEVTGPDGVTPYAEESYLIEPGDNISVQASVEDASLPSDVNGPSKTWIVTPVNNTISYEEDRAQSGNAHPVLELFRDTSPSQSLKTPTAITTRITTTTSITTNQAPKQWNLSGDWALRFAVTNAQGQTYDHHYTISQTGGSLSGTGYTPTTGTIVHHETVSGTIGAPTASAFTMHISYNDNSYYSDCTGTIDSTGKISGTWKDNYSPQNIGTFSSITGAAILK